MARAVDIACGLPDLHFRLFMYVVSRADMITGEAGVRTRISYQALSEATYIEPAPGRKVDGHRKKEEIRWALVFLCKNKYLTRRGELVFEVLFLSQENSVQNQSPRNLPAISTENTNDNRDLAGQSPRNLRVISHTSDRLEGEIYGGAEHPSKMEEGPLSETSLAAFFVDQGFEPQMARSTKAMQAYRQWIDAGASFTHVVTAIQIVRKRLQAKGSPKLASPVYFSQEIILATEGSCGHEVDRVLDG